MINKKCITYGIVGLAATSLFFSNGNSANAEEYMKPTSGIELIEKDSDIKLVERFLKLSKTSEITVVDSNNSVVNDEISSEVLTSINKDSLQEAVSLLKKYDYSLSSTHEEKDNTQNTSTGGITTYSVGSQVTRTFYKSHFSKDNTGKFGGSWISKMTVTYRENSNGTFTALGSPSLSVETSFGALFSPSVTGISTDYSYTSGNRGINYRASYNVKARLVVPVEIGGVEIPIGRMYYWGRTTDTSTVR